MTQITIRDVLNTFFYYRWVAANVILLSLILGGAVAYLVPPTYRAEARLLTFYAGYYSSQAERPDARIIPSFEPMQIVSVESEILNSQELHRALVMQDLPPNVDPLVLDRKLEQFERHFHISKVEAANVIEISYVDSQPEKAARTLERLIALYFKQRTGVFSSGRVAFLTSQRREAKQRLDDANAKIVEFQRRNGVVDIDTQIGEAVSANGQILQQKLLLTASLAQDESALAALTAQSGKVPQKVELFSDNTEAARALSSMQVTLLQLQGRRAELASRYTGDSPFVSQLDKQIDDVKTAIGKLRPQLMEATRTGYNTYYDTVQDRLTQLKANIAGATAKRDIVEAQLKDSDARLESLIAVASQIRQMSVDRDLLLDSFKNFSRQLEQAQIEQNRNDTISSTNVRVIQAPYPPARPSNPPVIFLAAALVVGVFAAGFIIVMLASLRETFINPEEAERSLGIPVLSAPIHLQEKVSTSQFLRGLFRRSRKEDDLAKFTHSRRDLGRLITAINKSAPEDSSKVALLVAYHAEDGVTQLTHGLALELERRSMRPVLVIDLNQNGRLAYGVPDATGELHWPEGGFHVWDDGVRALAAGLSPAMQGIFAFHPVRRHNIVVARPQAAAQLPLGRESVQMFEQLRKAYDYILIDAPPAASSFLGVEAAIYADATVLTIRAEETRKPVAIALKNQIVDGGGNVAGIVMTNRRSYIPNFIYRFL